MIIINKQNKDDTEMIHKLKKEIELIKKKNSLKFYVSILDFERCFCVILFIARDESRIEKKGRKLLYCFAKDLVSDVFYEPFGNQYNLDILHTVYKNKQYYKCNKCHEFINEDLHNHIKYNCTTGEGKYCVEDIDNDIYYKWFMITPKIRILIFNRETLTPQLIIDNL